MNRRVTQTVLAITSEPFKLFKAALNVSRRGSGLNVQKFKVRFGEGALHILTILKTS
jgi:hypothetical protein